MVAVQVTPRGTAVVVQTSSAFGVALDDFNPAKDGSADVTAKLRAAITKAQALGIGRIRISAGTYLRTMAGDADTVVIPSGITLDCDPGAVFRYGYWGSPCFALVNVQNAGIVGATFEYTGSFGTTTGTRDAFSYGLAIPSYEWCSDIVVAGSEYCRIENIRHYGASIASIQNSVISARSKADGTLCKGNRFNGVFADDVCQVWVGHGQEGGYVGNLRQGRYSTASVGLYGPSHIIYHTQIPGFPRSKNCIFENFYDDGISIDAVSTAGCLSFQFKGVDGSSCVFSNFVSSRPEGVLSVAGGLDDCWFRGVKWSSSDTTADPNTGAIFFSDQNGAAQNNNISIDLDLTYTQARNHSPINLAGTSTQANNNNVTLRGTIRRNTSGSESAAYVQVKGNKIRWDLIVYDAGSGNRAVINGSAASDCGGRVVVGGTLTNRSSRAIFDGTCSNCTCTFQSTGGYFYDANNAVPASGNNVNLVKPEYSTLRSLGTVTNPSATFTLPAPGTYLAYASIANGDNNVAVYGVYLVTFDDATSNDFTVAELIGTTHSKGGAAPTGLTVSVSNGGVVTISATAGAVDWSVKFAYKMLGFVF